MGNIVIAGGSGFIGRSLAALLKAEGHECVVLSRSGKGGPSARGVAWDAKTVGPWAQELEGAAAVVNLAGESISVPWTEENKRRIRDSRVESTGAIAQALAAAATPPPVWLNASAVGFYGTSRNRAFDETSPSGTGFLAETCRAWEEACLMPDLPGIRRCLVRIGVVFGPDGGAFPILEKLTRSFLGGQVGDGKQWMSWIHHRDLVRLMAWMLTNDVSGPVNGTSPNPATNAEVMAALRKALGRPWSPPAPAFALQVAKAFGAPEPSLVTEGARVLPKVAQEQGFRFEFGEIGAAVRDLVG